MINSFKLINEKPILLNKIIYLTLLLITLFAIWGIKTLNYQSFLKLHSKILYEKSFYIIEVLVPVKEVNHVVNNNTLIIDSKEYNYTIYKIDNNCTFKNNQNYQLIYLKIPTLEKEYLINGYETELKIKI